MYIYIYTYTHFLHPLFSYIFSFQSNTSWLFGFACPNILLCKLAHFEKSTEEFNLGTGVTVRYILCVFFSPFVFIKLCLALVVLVVIVFE